MRLLTFSFLKNCTLKSFFNGKPRKYSRVTQTEPKIPQLKGDPNYIEISPTWDTDIKPELRAAVLQDMQVYPGFVTEEEEASLLAELEPYLKRMRYEFDHWDDAIQGFRETERSQFKPENQVILDRVKALAFTTDTLPHVHVLDLAAAGFIKPHIDAVRFCGDVIAGVCLCSSAVMRLEHQHEPALALHALLERRALYVMKGVARYEFTHAVLGGERSQWRHRPVPRRRRVAVLCRARPEPSS